MKKYAADNLMLLRKNFNNLYHLLRNKERNEQHYIVKTSRSGHSYLEVMHNNLPVLMNSKYDPQFEASQWVESLIDRIGDNKHIFVYGVGLGYHLEQLLVTFQDRTFYIIEPEIEHMLAAIEARDLSVILNSRNIGVFAIGNDMMTMASMAALIRSNIYSSFLPLYLPFYERNEKDTINQFNELFQGAIREERSNLHTELKHKKSWTVNNILNIPYSMNGRALVNIKDMFKDIPMLIVGSGPSLNENIEMLRDLQHHVPIIAAGTSTQALLNAGIKPHLVVSIDGSDSNYKAFADLDLTDVCYSYAPISSYKITEHLHMDNLFHFHLKSEGITNHLLNVTSDTLKYYTQGTVSATAMEIALTMGSRKIILVGQDLSFPNNKVYADGVDHMEEDELERYKQQDVLEIENVKGGINLTTANMNLLLTGIENITTHNHDFSEFINTSSIGAKIKHTIQAPLSDFLDELKAFRIDREFFRTELKAHNKPYSDEEKKAISVRIKTTCKELVNLQKSTLLELITELDNLKISMSNHSQLSGALEKVDLKWQQLTQNRVFANIITTIMQGELRIYNKQIYIIQNTTDLKKKCELIVQHLGGFVSILNEDMSLIIDMFKLAIQRIESAKQ